MTEPGQAGVVAATRARVARTTERGREWADGREPGSWSWVGVRGWRCYRTLDGPLQSALLSLYILVAIFPALLVMEEYLESKPGALADRLILHYDLNASTAELLHDVLARTHTHHLGSALIAIAGALFFGLNFGRVLQVVFTRAWKLDLPPRQSDQGLYAAVLLAVYGLLLLMLVQFEELKHIHPSLKAILGLVWIGVLVLFFVWTPWLLTHGLLDRRDLLPGAVLTALGLVVVMSLSSFVMEFWVNLYAADYGGFGVVLAIYFWILFSSGMIVLAAAVAPALAERRTIRRTAG